MKKFPAGLVLAVIAIAGVAYVAYSIVAVRERRDQEHYDRGETELRVSNLSSASLLLFKAGRDLSDTTRVVSFDGKSIWLPPGNYFLSIREGTRSYYIPVSLTGYHCGPDDDGSFIATIRPMPKEFPPRLSSDLPEFICIPSGNFLLGDRLNPREPHYVWPTVSLSHPLK
jgi:hypothetical protein